MKVLFILSGLTHYFNAVLNRINSSGKIQVIAVVPDKKDMNVGKNVYLTDEGIEFKAYSLREERRFYGRAFFKGFNEVIENEKPAVVVFVWPYILELVFNRTLLKKLRKMNIKIFFKEIPFQIQPFKDAMLFRSTDFINENLEVPGNNPGGRINNFVTALIRKYYYSLIDLNLHYIEDGYRILKSYGVSRKKIFVTYNSPDTDRLMDIKRDLNIYNPILPENNQRLVHVGRLVKWKRVDLIINAIKKLKERFASIELIVIGEGPDRERLKQLSMRLHVEDRVKFIGAVYDPLILGQYFISSSIYVIGGMGGLSINEAMVFGKPIVCSVCDGTEKHLLRDNYNGFFFKANDIESLIEKLEILLSSREKIEEFGKNSLSIIEREININAVVKNYLEAFKSIGTP